MEWSVIVHCRQHEWWSHWGSKNSTSSISEESTTWLLL